MSANFIATKNFTTTGPPVTMVGLGGEGILRTHQRDARAREVIKTAVKQGSRHYFTKNTAGKKSSDLTGLAIHDNYIEIILRGNIDYFSDYILFAGLIKIAALVFGETVFH